MTVFRAKGSPYFQYDFVVAKRRYAGSTKETDEGAARRFENALRTPLKLAARRQDSPLAKAIAEAVQIGLRVSSATISADGTIKLQFLAPGE
jgi:hypothetical protein